MNRTWSTRPTSTVPDGKPQAALGGASPLSGTAGEHFTFVPLAFSCLLSEGKPGMLYDSDLKNKSETKSKKIST